MNTCWYISEDYSERFKTILAQQAELKTKRAEMEQRQAEDAELTSHMEVGRRYSGAGRYSHC